jgi:tetratricopeptide (TPR) repeat protein
VANALEAARNVLDLPALLLTNLLSLDSAAWTCSFFATEFVNLRRDRKIFEVGEIAPPLAPFDSPQFVLRRVLRHILGVDRLVVHQRAEAEKILRDLLRQSKKNYVSTYMIGTIYAGLGEKDKAFEFLEKAYQERSPDIPYFLKAYLRIDTLRSDARFQDLMRRVGIPQ